MQSLTRLQVAELCQRPHVQVLKVKGVGLSAGEVAHGLLVDHAHAAQLHQRTEQQRNLSEGEEKDTVRLLSQTFCPRLLSNHY